MIRYTWYYNNNKSAGNPKTKRTTKKTETIIAPNISHVAQLFFILFAIIQMCKNKKKWKSEKFNYPPYIYRFWSLLIESPDFLRHFSVFVFLLKKNLSLASHRAAGDCIYERICIFIGLMYMYNSLFVRYRKTINNGKKHVEIAEQATFPTWKLCSFCSSQRGLLKHVREDTKVSQKKDRKWSWRNDYRRLIFRELRRN